MPIEMNKVIARRHLEETWRHGDMMTADEVIAENISYHDPMSENISNIDSLKNYVHAVRTAFPDLKFTVEDIFAAGNKVALRWTFYGTHQGRIRGVDPTGKAVSFIGMSIYHILDGKIKEAWIAWDSYGYMQQLGLVPRRTKAAEA